MSKYILCALAVAVLLVASAQAGVIIVTPTAANASGWYTINPVSNLINPALDGMVEPDPTTPSTWYINSAGSGFWMASNAQNSNSGPPVVNTAWATFTLPPNSNLGMIDIWNWPVSSSLTRSTKVLSVYSCSDANGSNPVLITATSTISLAEGVAPPEPCQQFALTGATNVSFVKLAIVQSWAGEAAGATNWVSLGCVTFEGATTSSPEPGTLALLAAGLAGLLCYAWRKRR